MANVFDTIIAQTELECVNTMLGATGEAPIAQGELDAPSREETNIVIAIVREVLREFLSWGWKFNTEFQHRIAVGDTVTSKFDVPTDMLTFKVTQRSDQMGPVPTANADGTMPRTNLLDITTRAGFFYDRLRGTDEWVEDTDFERDQIFITLVRAIDYLDMPETAKRYVTIRSTRKYIQRILGDREIDRFTMQDEALAFRTLRKDQKHDKNYSMRNSPDIHRALGGRPSSGRRFI